MARGLNVLGRPACLVALLATLYIGGAAAHWQANLMASNTVRIAASGFRAIHCSCSRVPRSASKCGDS